MIKTMILGPAMCMLFFHRVQTWQTLPIFKKVLKLHFFKIVYYQACMPTSKMINIFIASSQINFIRMKKYNDKFINEL